MEKHIRKIQNIDFMPENLKKSWKISKNIFDLKFGGEITDLT